MRVCACVGGALGFYTEKIANAGLIGLVFATSPEFVAPFGAKQPILGTNPIACGVPTDQGLLLIDQATAAFPWFGLLEAKTAGIEIPVSLLNSLPSRQHLAIVPAAPCHRASSTLPSCQQHFSLRHLHTTTTLCSIVVY